MRQFSLVLITVSISLLLLGCNRVLYGEKTKYSSGYSEAGFRQIGQGMSMQEVAALIGNPLTQATQVWSEVWSYWPTESQPVSSRSIEGDMSYAFFGKVTHLQFTQAGLVSRTSGDYIDRNLFGLNKQQIEAKLGAPSKREVRQFEIIHEYSAPDASGSGTYKKREVRFDASRHVISVVSTTYYD